MKIMGPKNFLFPRFKPTLNIKALTLGTVPIPAGIVRYGKLTTRVTLIFMTAKFRRPT
jgi:hypothetical protein